MNARREPPRGTVGHPYSALNLRLALATFGLIFFVGLTAALFWLDLPVPAVISAAIALGAVINIIIVQRRRTQLARREPGAHDSLFE